MEEQGCWRIIRKSCFFGKFSIFVNYGGQFIKCGTSVEYLGGKFKTVHGLDVDRFGYFDLKEEVEKMGVEKFEKLVYRIPKINGADRFKDVVDDTVVMEMISHATKGRTLLEVYVVGEVIEEDNSENEASVESAPRSEEQFDVDSYIDNFSDPKNPNDVDLEAESQKDGDVNFFDPKNPNEVDLEAESPKDGDVNFSDPKNPNDVDLLAKSQKDGDVDTEVRNNLKTPQLHTSNVGDCEVGSGSGDDSEDEEYFPVDESSYDDELSVDDLASDDDGEYLEAGQNLKKHKKGILEDDEERARQHEVKEGH
ncbi:cytochrome P450 [Striga asiatica]|uniref:Cytochrome P450 n=1 Tax=Striga asiatica TaxID=4170 RepID=A0A5A7QH69_STRAF|nr:cytochrome P450 [Striga asiatica]